MYLEEETLPFNIQDFRENLCRGLGTGDFVDLFIVSVPQSQPDWHCQAGGIIDFVSNFFIHLIAQIYWFTF